MIQQGYVDFLGPLGTEELGLYWEKFWCDHKSHRLSQCTKERLLRTVPIVLYGDEGTSGQNSFMLGTWSLCSS